MVLRKQVFRLMIVFYFVLTLDGVSAARLPIVGGDNGTWGTVLNEFLNVTMAPTGLFWPNIINSTFITDGSIRDGDLASDASISLTKIENLTNKIRIDIANVSGVSYHYNQTISALSYTDVVLLRYYNISDIEGKNYLNISGAGSYNDSSFIRIVNATLSSQLSSIAVDNASFNQSLTDLLYTPILWSYNQTLAAQQFSLSMVLNSTQLNNTYYLLSNPSGYVNQTVLDARYYNKSQIESNFTLFYLSSNPSGFLTTTSIANTTIARTGNCPAGSVVQNTTTGGVQCVPSSSSLGVGSVNNTHILDLTIVAADIANGVITAAKLVAGIITSDYLAVSSVNSTHIVDGTITGSDVSTSANLTVNSVNASVSYLGLEVKTDECNSLGCTATATCSTGKTIIDGMTAPNSGTCDTNPSVCTAYCTPGSTSCAITETDVVFNVASVRIICAKLL